LNFNQASILESYDVHVYPDSQDLWEIKKKRTSVNETYGLRVKNRKNGWDSQDLWEIKNEHPLMKRTNRVHKT